MCKKKFVKVRNLPFKNTVMRMLRVVAFSAAFDISKQKNRTMNSNFKKNVMM